ncbi:MAG: hypothetical protein HZY73_09175 [Micropruina sp.]|nr:MAG: hypothetical protein HZY73_09175 [Micropruina sp.]
MEVAVHPLGRQPPAFDSRQAEPQRRPVVGQFVGLGDGLVQTLPHPVGDLVPGGGRGAERLGQPGVHLGQPDPELPGLGRDRPVLGAGPAGPLPAVRDHGHPLDGHAEIGRPTVGQRAVEHPYRAGVVPEPLSASSTSTSRFTPASTLRNTLNSTADPTQTVVLLCSPAHTDVRSPGSTAAASNHRIAGWPPRRAVNRARIASGWPVASTTPSRPWSGSSRTISAPAVSRT